HAGWKVIDQLAGQLIVRADFDFIEPVEHVEFGERKTIDAGDGASLAHHHRIEPAAAPRTTGIDAELMANAAQGLAHLIVLLGRKRSPADARRVGLYETQYVSDGARTDARSRRRLARDHVRRRDERIGAVVDIKHHALCALKENAPAKTHGLI